MNNLPASVPCWRRGCEAHAAFEGMEQYPRDVRPVFGCECGANMTVRLDELPDYIAEFTR